MGRGVGAGFWRGSKGGGSAKGEKEKKIRSARCATVSGFCCWRNSCWPSNALLACAAALQLAHLVRSDGQGLGALYDRCSQPETAK